MQTNSDTKPPRIALIVNRPHLLHFSYIRYLTNFLREQFDFDRRPIDANSKTNSRDQTSDYVEEVNTV